MDFLNGELQFLLGIPICGGPVRREESAFQTSDEYQRIVNDKWKSKCYKATGVDVDIERMSRLNLEVDKCIEKAMNISQMREAVVATVPILANGSNFNFIDQRRADAFSRKFVLANTPFKLSEITQ